MTAHKHIKITKREDLRVGDIATFTYRGHEFTGPLWRRSGDSLIVGSAPARHGNGTWSNHLTFIRAFRPTCALPTEPGAVILVTECRGERADEPVLAVLASTGRWWTHEQMFDDHAGHLPEHITEWTTATVVPAPEVSA